MHWRLEFGDRTTMPVSTMPGPLFRTDTMITITQISAQEVYVGVPSGHNAVGSRPVVLEKSTT